jgi:riboflavin kinase/FMN adenylyltransferase
VIQRITGKVVGGKRMGRKLGFPTANIALVRDDALPPDGVYAGRIFIPGEAGARVCVLNQGKHPTLPEGGSTIEVYILDFDRDIYGETVTVEYLRFLRPERRFEHVDALKAQIRADADEARKG